MRVFFFHIILWILSSSLLLGQTNSSSWFIQGGLADWEFFMQDRQSFDLKTNLSIGKQIGNRYLLGAGMMSQLEGSWPSKRSDSWTFSWFPSWIGGMGRIYLKKITFSEKRLNPYVEIGLGGIIWSSIRQNPNAGIFERVNFMDFAWTPRAGASIWLVPALSLDLQTTYFPYSFREESSRSHIRPHELFFSLSFSYWFVRQ